MSCRSCGAPIEWALTTAGKRMPLDLEPAPQGNLVLDDDGVVWAVAAAPVALLAKKPPLRQSHFATCPNANHHRKRT